jgi:hypothetical protein
MNVRAFLAAALVVTTTTLSASAQQPWIQDRKYGEGIGIRSGDLELHPGVAGELGYDSNYFQRAPREEGGPIPVWRLRVTPHLTLKTLGPQRRETGGEQALPTVNFNAGVYLSANAIFSADSDHPDSDQVSDHNHLAAGAAFGLDILPGRPWGVDLYGDFVRTTEPSNFILEDTRFDRDTLRLGFGINWRPGGGLFDWRLGYEGSYHFFEKASFETLNNVQHTVMTRGRWRFLPRTALLYDGRMTFVRYSDTASQNDGEVVNSRIGFNGLITHHFSLLAMAGWAASFYDTTNVPARNFDGPTAQVELKWFILPQPQLQPGEATVGLSSIAVGYTRDYGNSYLGDYYRRDRGYVNFSYFAGGVVLIAVGGGYAVYSHSESFFPGGAQRHGEFRENRADAMAFAEYRLSDSVGVNTTLRYNASLNNNSIRTNPDNPAERDALQFTRWEAWLGVRWFM